MINNTLYEYIENNPNYKNTLDSSISNLIDSMIDEDKCTLNHLYSNLYFAIADYIDLNDFSNRHDMYERVRYFMDRIKEILECETFIKFLDESDYIGFDYFRDQYNDKIKIDIRDLINGNDSAIYEIFDKYADETMSRIDKIEIRIHKKLDVYEI